MPFLFAFLLPVFLILIFNIVMYILIIRAIIAHTVRKSKRRNKSPITKSQAVRMLVSYSGIMILFGITWLFAVFTFITEPDISFIVQFFFAFFNTSQGFFIFFFFVLLNNESREAWKSLICPNTMRCGKKWQASIISAINSKLNLLPFYQKKSPGNETFPTEKREKSEPQKSKSLKNDKKLKDEAVSEKKGALVEDNTKVKSIQIDHYLSMQQQVQ